MKYLAVTATLALAIAVPALAQESDQQSKPKPEVVERNAQGQPTKVKIGDTVHNICIGDVQDSCINPRDAGLDFGTRELSYWPGKPASQIDTPLPPTREQAVKEGIISEDQPAEAPPSE